MKIENKRWLLVIAIVALVGFLFMLLSDIYETPQRRPPQPYRIFLSPVLLTVGIIPISYYLISRRLEEKLEKNMKVISRLVNKKNLVPEKNLVEMDTKTIILKFLDPAERKVLEKLIERKGVVLQSEISRMEGMNKLKTHRIVKDMLIKGVVKTEAHGKTRRLILSKDIKDVVLK